MRRFLKAGYDLTPDHDLVAQALTSRVAKQAVLRWFPYPQAGGREPEKPLKFSFFTPRGEGPLGRRGGARVLKGGEKYRFYVLADLERLGDDAAMRLLEPPGRVQLYGSYASLELAEARIEAPAEEPLGKYLTVKFHTPTLLQYPKAPKG
ncbi:hypothetical protein [Pyrobaculum aerophilum]|uniref:hypothetical protein n=1 Tax=Pyrobaculum aerophilum TaxID=13773 RepID=UPI002FDA84AE